MVDIELLDKASINSFNWPAAMTLHREWLKPFMLQPTNSLIYNIQTELKLLKLDDVVMPVTINNEEYENSYVCSPYTMYIAYARSELHKLKSAALILPLKVLLSSIGSLLKAGRINQVVHVNNWLLSTNLYDTLPLESIPHVTKMLVTAYPKHYIFFRSLNPFTNSALLKTLENNGYLCVPSRKVYIFDRKRFDYLKCNNVKWDLQLLKKTKYQLVTPDEINESDYSRMEELYNDLYLKKYSYHNPQFSRNFIRLCHQHKLMTLYGLRDAEGNLQGVVGYFVRNGIMTTPIVGYNTSLPQKDGLYRMLIALVLRDAAEQDIILNLSSGASEFKRLRGGMAETEYSAAFVSHLPMHQKATIYGIRTLLKRIAFPLIDRFKL